MIATGVATMAFGINDIVTAMTGRNFIQEITGMSDKAYFWSNLALNLASTVFSVSASMAKAKGLIKCFPAGTGVLAVKSNGAIDRVAIEDIKVGDRVMSYNEATGMTEVKTVTQTFTSTHEEVVKVTHSGGQTITSSVGHRYYTQRGWIGAEDLRAGDILQLVNGDTVVVELVQHELLENSQTLYNFEVDGNHDYYVAENTEVAVNDFVLVHNDCKVTSNGDGYKTFENKNQLEEHFSKHGKEFEGMFKDSKAYLDGANHVIKNGTFVPEMNGYIRFFGANGGANYAFVGLKNEGAYISTFGIRSVKDLSKYISWLIP